MIAALRCGGLVASGAGDAGGTGVGTGWRPGVVDPAFTVDVEGGTVAGRDAGSGPAVLVLHGGPGLSDYSDMLAGELVGWRAVRYTQRGVVPSTARDPYSVQTHVADALAVLDARGVDRAVLLGHSWGAFLACSVAAAAPDRVRALVLVDGLGLVGDGGFAEFGAELTRRTPRSALDQARRIDERADRGEATDTDDVAALRLIWPAYFAVPAAAPPLPDTVRTSGACYAGTWASIDTELAAGTIATSLRSYPGPVEVVIGATSPMPRSAAQQTAALFPRASLTSVPDAGHFPWVEQPGCVHDALRRLPDDTTGPTAVPNPTPRHPTPRQESR